jgi:hypothetical protein
VTKAEIKHLVTHFIYMLKTFLATTTPVACPFSNMILISVLSEKVSMSNENAASQSGDTTPDSELMTNNNNSETTTTNNSETTTPNNDDTLPYLNNEQLTIQESCSAMLKNAQQCINALN